jgi:hypothetical protein
MVAADTSQAASYGTPAKPVPLHTGTPNAEPGGSNLRKRARPLDLARQVQGKLLGQSPAMADASFLSSSLSSSPVVAGGFQLNYDQETPLRAIDIGGHDQEEKFVI